MSLIPNKPPGPLCEICSKKVEAGQKLCFACSEDPDLKQEMTHVVSNFHGRRTINFDGGRTISKESKDY